MPFGACLCVCMSDCRRSGRGEHGKCVVRCGQSRYARISACNTNWIASEAAASAHHRWTFIWSIFLNYTTITRFMACYLVVVGERCVRWHTKKNIVLPHQSGRYAPGDGRFAQTITVFIEISVPGACSCASAWPHIANNVPEAASPVGR